MPVYEDEPTALLGELGADGLLAATGLPGVLVVMCHEDRVGVDQGPRRPQASCRSRPRTWCCPTDRQRARGECRARGGRRARPWLARSLTPMGDPATEPRQNGAAGGQTVPGPCLVGCSAQPGGQDANEPAVRDASLAGWLTVVSTRPEKRHLPAGDRCRGGRSCVHDPTDHADTLTPRGRAAPLGP